MHDDGQGVLLPGRFRVPASQPEDGMRELSGEYGPDVHVRAYLRALYPIQRGDGEYLEVVHGPRLALPNGKMRLAVTSRAARGNPALDPETGEVLMERGKPRTAVEVAPDCAIDLSAPLAAEQVIAAARKDRHEVFCGVLPRVRDRRGLAIPDRSYVHQGSVIWVDIDDPDEVWRLEVFSPRPHLIVRSGSGGAHGYWRVKRFGEDGARSIAAPWIERANLRLVHHVGGDAASYDRLRIMRVPGTRNSKAGAWAHVAWADLSGGAYDIRDVVGELSDPPDDKKPAATPPRRRTARKPSGPDPARDIYPADYVRMLAEVDVDRHGYCRCPLPDHDERTGSFKAYGTPERGWACFGCKAGGGIYELAAGLSGIDPSREFLRLKRWVYERCGLQMPGA